MWHDKVIDTASLARLRFQATFLPHTMDELSKLFSLLPKEMKDEAERQYNRDLSLKNKNIRSIPPDPVSDLTNKLDLEGIDTSNPDLLREALLKSLSNIKPAHPPLELLPCANVEATKYKACLKPGTKACGACRLVSYCSQVSDCHPIIPSPLMLHHVGVSEAALAST